MSGMIGDAFSIAIVVFSISVSMAKIFAKRHNYKIDANQVISSETILTLASSTQKLAFLYFSKN